MKTTLYTILLAMTAMLVACDANYTTEAKSELVVEGWIDEGGYPVVILTKSLTISDKYQQADSLSQYLIRWAKVSVSDGERTVVLTGKFDSRYFPPYVYTTGNMRGEAGKTYTLDVEYRDFHATATTTIPETHRIENLTVKPCADSDTLYQVKINIDTERANGEYYQLFTCEGKDNRLFVHILNLQDKALYLPTGNKTVKKAVDFVSRKAVKMQKCQGGVMLFFDAVPTDVDKVVELQF